jgi:hypothetical protein
MAIFAILSLIVGLAFFDRSYRYNRPPKAPLLGQAGEPCKVYSRGLKCK